MANIENITNGWFCFSALPKKEHIAAGLIKKNLDLDVYCPRLSRRKMTRRGRVTFLEPVFPCYLFVGGDIKSNYRSIMATQGILKILSHGSSVAKIPNEFIEELKSLIQSEDDIKVLEDEEWTEGEKVTITEGPFKDLESVVCGNYSGSQRVAVLLELLGQTVEVDFDINQLIRENEPSASILWKE